MMNNKHIISAEYTILNIKSLVYLIILVIFILIFIIFQIFNSTANLFPLPENNLPGEHIQVVSKLYSSESEEYWIAPELNSIKGSALEAQILYGRDLIQNTSKYLGPGGSVIPISNGMNCQNCHLDAGTKIFGNNYGSVASSFPKFRARSGREENIYKRVNDCFERSLNGIGLDTATAEMQAIKAYMLFLGSNVKKGTVVKGSGLKEISYLNRAADPLKGKLIYNIKCSTCHMPEGQGSLARDGLSYIYPPLWGGKSYNDAAGLYRLSNFAKYVKFNMPLGTTFDAPQLSDEEAWDLGAYVNSQPRPHKYEPNDWPDISKKPIDYPFEPYIDSFNEKQHKYGPYKPMTEALKQK